jgi:hypothetical protein
VVLRNADGGVWLQAPTTLHRGIVGVEARARVSCLCKSVLWSASKLFAYIYITKLANLRNDTL